eukprot:200751_1
MFAFWLLSSLFALASSLGCGWVDVGSVTLRLESCYVQCQEVTEECWDQRFYCDEGQNLHVQFFRDHAKNCGGDVIADKVVDIKKDKSIEDFSCEGDANTCTTFKYEDNVHNAATDTCGFLQVDVKLVAEACFTGEKGKYFKQNCDDGYTTDICEDAQCTDCVNVPKNIYGFEIDHCMKVKCEHEKTGAIIGSPLFIKGTHKLKYINYFNPTKWTLMMWITGVTLVLLSIVVCLQFRIYKNTKRGGNDYHLTKMESDSEQEKLC